MFSLTGIGHGVQGSFAKRLQKPSHQTFNSSPSSFQKPLSADVLTVRFGHGQTPSLERQAANLERLIMAEYRQSQGPNARFQLTLPPMASTDSLAVPDAQRLAENKRTYNLFTETFTEIPWTGIECSNPVNRMKQRWCQMNLTGLYRLPGENQPSTLEQQVAMMKKLQLENLRLGMPNHLMNLDDPASFDIFGNVLHAFKQAGIKISLDMLHFGLPDEFRNDRDRSKSFFLNPKWPEYMGKFTEAVVSRYYDDLAAITIVNEPYVTNMFSNGMWNEHFPGWSTEKRPKPDFDHFFIERAMLIAKAAILSRTAIERYKRDNHKPDKVFIHNEACEYRTDNPVFNQFTRFLPSDLILGAQWLLKGDYKQSEMYREFLHPRFVRPGHPEDEAKLNAGLDELRNMHQGFSQEFNGKTMKTDTVFGVDFYMVSEGGKLEGDKPLRYDRHAYADDLANGRRRGFYGMAVDYWNRYQLPIAHTETNILGIRDKKGRRRPNASYWHRQQILEQTAWRHTERMMQQRQPDIRMWIPSHNMYSLYDQTAWNKGLNVRIEKGTVDPNGLVKLDGTLRPFAKEDLPRIIRFIRSGALRHATPLQPQGMPEERLTA